MKNVIDGIIADLCCKLMLVCHRQGSKAGQRISDRKRVERMALFHQEAAGAKPYALNPSRLSEDGTVPTVH